MIPGADVGTHNVEGLDQVTTIVVIVADKFSNIACTTLSIQKMIVHFFVSIEKH